MPWGLKRYQNVGTLHFITFSCYRRQPLLMRHGAVQMFEQALEEARAKYGFFVFGYVVMPEHVHLLVSEPERGTLATAIKALKQSVARRVAHPVNLLIARNLNERVAHPAFFWRGGAFRLESK